MVLLIKIFTVWCYAKLNNSFNSQSDTLLQVSFDTAYTTIPCVFEDNSKNKVVSTCPCTVGTGDQKYDELKGESSIISVIKKQHT